MSTHLRGYDEPDYEFGGESVLTMVWDRSWPIIWCGDPPPIIASPTSQGGGAPSPVVVVQSDAFNRSRIQTVVVATITSNLRLSDAPGNVKLTRRQSGLPEESVINVSQLLTLDRSYLTRRARKLSPRLLAALDEGLRLVLSV